MDKQEFLEKLVNIFDVDEVKETDVLRDFDSWDSLAILSIVALADAKFGFSMKALELKTLVTVADLYKYLEENKRG